MNAIQKLRQLTGEVAKGPASAMQAWPTITRLLARMPLDQSRVEQVCAQRDPVGLDVLVTQLEHPEAVQSQPHSQPGDSVAKEAEAKSDASGADEAEVSVEDKRAAMRAFRKRTKLARVAGESGLGGRSAPGGHSSEIDAIMPPDNFSPAVWKALAAEGRLKYTGQGFYALA